MKHLLLDSRKFPATDVDDIVHQLIHRGYGDDIAPVALMQKHLKGLPVGQEQDWERSVKQDLVTVLKTDISKVATPEAAKTETLSEGVESVEEAPQYTRDMTSYLRALSSVAKSN